MPLAIFIEITGMFILSFECLLIIKNKPSGAKTKQFLTASALAFLLILSEIFIIFNGVTMNTLAKFIILIKIMISAIIPILLSVLIEKSGFQSIKILLIFSCLETITCILYILQNISLYFRIFNCATLIFSLLILLNTYRRSFKQGDLFQKYLLSALLVFIAVAYLTEDFNQGVFLIGTFTAVFILLFYVHSREELINMDPLTGIQNRFSFDKRMAEIQKAPCAAIIVLDLNNLKTINDTWGHTEGDRCLSVVANILTASFDDIGVAYRIGGDEFCVLCYDIDKRKLNDAFNKFKLYTEKLRDHSIPIEIAYGYEFYNKSKANSIFDSFAKADLAMYEHKAIMKSQ